jgi:energy-coupling factor transporter ATP-binding protein EcfA2
MIDIIPRLKTLWLNRVGCIEEASIRFNSRVNVICGPDASGKTTFVRSILSVLGEDRGSLSASRGRGRKGCIRLEADSFSVEGVFTEAGLLVGWEKGRRDAVGGALLIDDADLMFKDPRAVWELGEALGMQVIMTAGDQRFAGIPGARVFRLERSPETGLSRVNHPSNNAVGRMCYRYVPLTVDRRVNEARIHRFAEKWAAGDTVFSRRFIIFKRHGLEYRFGVEEACLADYLDMGRRHRGDLGLHFFRCLCIHLPAGVYRLWLGLFKCNLEIKDEDHGRTWILGGVDLRGLEVWYVLRESYRFEDGERFIEFVKEVRKKPEVARRAREILKAMDRGIGLPLGRRVRLQVRAMLEGGIWRLVPYNFEGDAVTLEGGLGDLLMLIDTAQRGREAFSMLRRLVPGVVLEEWTHRCLEVEEEAWKLVEELQLAYSSRISRYADMGRRGFLVEGESGRTYFVDEDSLGVYVYPGFREVCVQDVEEQVMPWGDRIASRILLLMNDLKLGSSVHTLFERR